MRLLPLISAKELSKLEGMSYQGFANAWPRWVKKYGFPLPVRPGKWCPLAIAEYRKNRSTGASQCQKITPDIQHNLAANLDRIS